MTLLNMQGPTQHASGSGRIFNDLGCSTSGCRFLHYCFFCNRASARTTCPHNLTKHSACKYLSTPISAFATALKNHIASLLASSYNVVHTASTQICKLCQIPATHATTYSQPSLIPTLLIKLLVREVHLRNPPFPTFRISLIGVATRKYSGNGSTVPSSTDFNAK